MAQPDFPFNRALATLMMEWQEAIERCIEFGKSRGVVRKQVNSKQVALFVSAGYGGVRNMGKLYGQSCYYTFILRKMAVVCPKEINDRAFEIQHESNQHLNLENCRCPMSPGIVGIAEYSFRPNPVYCTKYTDQ